MVSCLTIYVNMLNVDVRDVLKVEPEELRILLITCIQLLPGPFSSGRASKLEIKAKTG